MAPITKRLSRQLSSTRWRCRAAAATRYLPTPMPRMTLRRSAFAYGGRRGKAKLLNPEDQEWKPVLHPIVRTHPETGLKALYCDPGKIHYFVGIADEGGVIVEHEMDVEIGRHRLLDLGQELAEFNRAVTLVAAADDVAGSDVQGGE
jgi:hypothetical protein